MKTIINVAKISLSHVPIVAAYRCDRNYIILRDDNMMMTSVRDEITEFADKNKVDQHTHTHKHTLTK